MTDKSVVPIDWSQPIEAVHEDGRVVPVSLDPEYEAPDAVGHYTLLDEPSPESWYTWLQNGRPWMGEKHAWRIRNVASNPLNLETSDLDPITPEEDAAAMGVIAQLGFTGQVRDSVVRGMRAGLAKAGAVIVPGWQPIETAPRDGTPFIATLVVHNLAGHRWRETHVIFADDETGEVASDCEAGWTSIDDYEHWMPLPSAHSIQSGGEGGEG